MDWIDIQLQFFQNCYHPIFFSKENQMKQETGFDIEVVQLKVKVAFQNLWQVNFLCVDFCS